jgi:amidase
MPTRRRFLALSAAATAAAAAPQLPATASPAPARPSSLAPRPSLLDEATIEDLRVGMEERRWSAEDITSLYLQRIAEIDDPKGPVGLNSILELNPDALATARQLDEERKAGRVRGPLHGIPILLKDNIDTAGRMQTTAGSLALAGHYAPRDSFVAQKLREAGAILLGKTNLSEWANFRSTKSSSGWSARGGQTKNPYALDRNPCGSSSGSGAAASANLAAAAIGTETDGSIVCPSTANGLVGIKPTVGLVSRSGIIPISHTQDTAGPMARTVADAAAVLTAIAGFSRAQSSENHHHLPTRPSSLAPLDYTTFLDKAALKSARIGVARKNMGFHPAVDSLVENAIDVMRQAGATIVDPANLPEADINESEFTVLLYEFKHDLNAYLAQLPPGDWPRTLAELIAFNEKHAKLEMPYFGQEIFHMAEAKGGLDDKAYKEALAKNIRLTREEGIDAIVKKEKLDALIAPTGAPAWMTDLVVGDHYTGGFSSPSAVSGYPHITVPMGTVFGLPVGLSFFSTAWTEPKLISLAYAFEQLTQARQSPTFLPTADLTVSEDVTTPKVAAMPLKEKHCGM